MILALDLSWFATIPGMLITGGVLLLVIALIIFIATSGKKGSQPIAVTQGAPAQEATLQEAPQAPKVEGPIQQEVQPQPQPVMQPPQAITNPVNGEKTDKPTPEVLEKAAPVVTPLQQMNMDSSPNVAPVIQTPVVNPVPQEKEKQPEPSVIASNPGIQTQTPPVVQNTTPEPITQKPVEPIVSPVLQNSISMPQAKEEPIVKEPLQQPAPVPAEPVIPLQQEKQPTTPHAPIYGGVSSIIPNLDVAPHADRPIYGGANPLQNTQPIPVQNQPQPVSTPQPKPASPVVNKVSQDTLIMPQIGQISNQNSQTPPVVQAQPQPVAQQNTSTGQVQPESLF